MRYGVLGFACVLATITYLDRFCFGLVLTNVEREFGLSENQKGLIGGAFVLAYSIFEVPSGWLGDVYGPKRTLIRIVIWWSLFTTLTGLIWPFSINLGLFVFNSFAAMIMVQFLFGAGEAGAFPNISRTFHNWFPITERGFAQGAVWMAGRLGGGITAFVVMGLMIRETMPDGSVHVYWRHIFWIFGGLGLFWCFFFWRWFRDRPENHPSVNEAELAVIHGIWPFPAPKVDLAARPLEAKRPGATDVTDATGAGYAVSGAPPTHASTTPASAGGGHASHFNVPWGRLLTNRNLWLLCLMYFCSAYGWYFNLLRLPEYLEKQYGVTVEKHGYLASSLLKGAPLLIGSLACLFGGLLTDWFIRRTGDRKWGRRLFGVVGHGACAISWFIALTTRSEVPFVLCVALAAFCNDLTMGAAWASCLDIGRKYSGIVSGCMNTVGNLGGFVAAVAGGMVLQQLGFDLGWRVNMISYGAIYVIAVGLWLMFDATKPVVQEED